MSSDTIVAIATPPGVGAVGIVRVSGAEAKVIGQAVTARALRPRLATFCPFVARDGTQIDAGVALFFAGPRSFTGEDVLELQGHGGPVVLDLLLSRCLELGARTARPGEFSERAFLNGKLDLAQAEAIADLIESTTTVAARLAARSLQGAFSSRVRAIVQELIRFRTVIEGAFDFPEDEVEVHARGTFAVELDSLVESVDQLLAQAQQGERIRNGLTVVIAGRPNVGKSSLLNRLADCDAAIVDAVPGTTRDLLPRDIQIDGLPLRIIDSAGIRETAEPVEQEGVRRAREQLHKADHILWIYDSTLGLDPEELRCLPRDIPVTVVRNKVDLDTASSDERNPDVSPGLEISALTGRGIAELRQHLKSSAGSTSLGEGSFSARRRHLDALRRGHAALNGARSTLSIGLGPEVVALELWEAQRAFGEITGEVTPDDLLDKIFSTFCIGK